MCVAQIAPMLSKNPLLFASSCAVACALAAQTPPARAHSALAYDPTQRAVVLAGGSTTTPGASAATTFGDHWSWDGRNWRNSNTQGLIRSGHAIAFLPALGNLVAIGGNDGPDQGATALRLDNGKWLPLEGGPTPRSGAALAVDARRGVLVVFGGSVGAGDPFGDMFEFDGSRWRMIEGVLPPPRTGASMAFHAATGKTVLFGGRGRGQEMLKDTWTWDGHTWTLVDSTGPGARTGAGMATDERRGTLVLFGGTGPGFRHVAPETWTWDGTRWTLRSTTGGPSSRGLPVMAYDPARGVVVLFGGRLGRNLDSNETWEWDGAAWTQRTP